MTQIEMFPTNEIFHTNDVELSVVNDIVDRQKRGLNKYGVSVANNPLSLREWHQHAYEEALDLAIYLRRIIQEMDKNEVVKK